MAILYGCSTQKNTPATRAYHELTTRYNVFFNAQQSYDETLNSLFENNKESWHLMLPLYPNSINANDTTQKALGGPFNLVIDKTTKAIQEHSISAKPKRDRDKMSSQEYRDWLRQNEFNPFIDQAWLLMGKAHVQNGDYMEAISVFANTIRLFGYDLDVVSEAQVWLIRAYSEIGWYTDAEVLVDGLQARGIPQYLQADFIGAHTYLLVKQGKYEDVIPVLNSAIYIERNSAQRRRMQFILGQIYSELGYNNQAYDALEKVKGLNTPYETSLNAMMEQSKVANDSRKIVDDLKKHSRRANNDIYLDQIFGAIGDYYYLNGDTINAIDNYLSAESKSVSNGVVKSLVQEKLGWIYYTRKNYISSGKRYLEAVSQFPKDHLKYSEVSHRAEVLGELMPHLTALHEQDSLQHLASLPQEEQLKVINAHITYLKRLERNESTRSLVEQLQNSVPSIGIQPTAMPGQGSVFYFYNSQLVSQGIGEFKKRWGNRKLEDNWRTGSTPSVVDFKLDAKTDTVDNKGTPSKESVIFTSEYWLKQLPTTPESVAASNSLIESSLFEIGNIAKNRLRDFDLATSSYLRLYNDFAESQHIADVAYNLYMIYRQSSDMSTANTYRNKIITNFPESDYALMMTHPEYEAVMSNYARMEDALYQDSYQAYQQGNVSQVHKNFEKAIRLFSTSTLMPKFNLLDALSYAMKGDIDNLKLGLEQLVSNYSNSSESVFAQNILSGLGEGRELVANANVMSDMDWISGIISSSSKGEYHDYITDFDENRAQPHSLLLIFDDKVQNRNELLFAVANHNFSTYQLRAFSTSFIKIGDVNALIVKTFSSYDEANLYSSRVANDPEFKESISDSLSGLVVSDANLTLLLSSKSIEKYREFMEMDDGAIVGEKKDAIKDSVIDEDIYTLPPVEIKVPEDPQVEKEHSEDMQAPTENPIVKENVKPITIDEKLQELERRQEQAINQSEQPLSEKERKKQLRDREKERKELIKLRQRELKQKEKARNEDLKRRDRERQQKIKEQEQIRKAKLQERARLLRDQNR